MSKRVTIAVCAVAIFFSMTGGALAVSHYVITSTHQIKPSVLAKLHGARGPRGRQGAQGSAGTQGPAGPAGPIGPAGTSAASQVVVTVVNGPTVTIPVATSNGPGFASSSATCPSGESAGSGGGAALGVESAMAASLSAVDETTGDSSWVIYGVNYSGSQTGTVQAEAYCSTQDDFAPSGGVRSDTERAPAVPAVTKLIKKLRSEYKAQGGAR